MTETVYKTFEDLPMFLSVSNVAQLLGISPSSCYELMHDEDFPSIRIGSRIIVPRDELIKWLDGKMTK